MGVKVKYALLSLAYLKVMFHRDQPFQMQLVTLFCYKGCHPTCKITLHSFKLTFFFFFFFFKRTAENTINLTNLKELIQIV